jgi:tRNA (guanine37-N1)-methyltransferase
MNQLTMSKQKTENAWKIIRESQRLFMQRRDRQKKITVNAIRTHCKHCGTYQKRLKKCILKIPKVRNIVQDINGDKDYRMILLNEDITLTADQNKFIASIGGEIETNYEVKLGYDHFSTQEILRQILPPNIVDVPSHFETAGHIAHFNLRDELLPYKKIIGDVIIDKNKNIRTVVNKTSSIATEFRTFPMEVISGENNLNCQLNESGCKFKFNFEKVYWNSRLQKEHDTVVKAILSSNKTQNDVVCDMMCGIGPFAIPLAKKGVKVYANDLNPESYKYLVSNKILNKINDDMLMCSNLDGRDFVRKLRQDGKTFTHVLMNLPALGIEFLDVFVDGCMSDWPDDVELPLVHTYCFSKSPTPQKDVVERVEKVLGYNPIQNYEKEVRIVRDVAPNKLMLCAEFRLLKVGSGIKNDEKNKNNSTKRKLNDVVGSGNKKSKK